MSQMYDSIEVPVLIALRRPHFAPFAPFAPRQELLMLEKQLKAARESGSASAARTPDPAEERSSGPDGSGDSPKDVHMRSTPSSSTPSWERDEASERLNRVQQLLTTSLEVRGGLLTGRGASSMGGRGPLDWGEGAPSHPSRPRGRRMRHRSASTACSSC